MPSRRGSTGNTTTNLNDSYMTNESAHRSLSRSTTRGFTTASSTNNAAAAAVAGPGGPGVTSSKSMHPGPGAANFNESQDSNNILTQSDSVTTTTEQGYYSVSYSNSLRLSDRLALARAVESSSKGKSTFKTKNLKGFQNAANSVAVNSTNISNSNSAREHSKSQSQAQIN